VLLKRVQNKRDGVQEELYCEGYRVFGSLCVLGCNSAVVLQGACVRDCRGMAVCTVGTIN
jgi:hypothetical protein